jgi:hypothetical protein
MLAKEERSAKPDHDGHFSSDIHSAAVLGTGD